MAYLDIMIQNQTKIPIGFIYKSYHACIHTNNRPPQKRASTKQKPEPQHKLYKFIYNVIII